MLTPLIVVTLFTLTFFIYEDFTIRMLYGYCVLAFFVAWYFVTHQETITFHTGKRIAFFLAVILTLLLLWPTARMGQGMIYLILSADIGMILVILADPQEEELRVAMKLFKIGAVLVSLYLIAVEISPGSADAITPAIAVPTPLAFIAAEMEMTVPTRKNASQLFSLRKLSTFSTSIPGRNSTTLVFFCPYFFRYFASIFVCP